MEEINGSIDLPDNTWVRQSVSERECEGDKCSIDLPENTWVRPVLKIEFKRKCKSQELLICKHSLNIFLVEGRVE